MRASFAGTAVFSLLTASIILGGGPLSGSDEDTLPHFSFFVTSLRAMQDLSGNPSGFGGDLRFGETGPGAGLRGADKICTTLAERSMPGSSAKEWRAFLSVTADENGRQVDAIDRIGEGPWYDRLGRLVAQAKADLLHDRPQNGDPTIQNDLPNEDGVPNHQPDPNRPLQENHHTMTGSTRQGTLFPSCPRDPGCRDECLEAVTDNPQGCLDYCMEDGTDEATCQRRCTDHFIPTAFCSHNCLGPRGQIECDNPYSSATCNDWTTSEGGGGRGKGPRIGLSWPRMNPSPQRHTTWAQHWLSFWSSPGCEPGGEAIERSRGRLDRQAKEVRPTVGGGGGYGGIYCFALEP